MMHAYMLVQQRMELGSPVQFDDGQEVASILAWKPVAGTGPQQWDVTFLVTMEVL
jgi:hypothetical protein